MITLLRVRMAIVRAARVQTPYCGKRDRYEPPVALRELCFRIGRFSRR
jgi:hypothetical protein